VTDLSALAHVACGFAAVGAGAVNAMAGGGTLISFPVMTAVGVPSVHANATNTVALCPGYVGGAYAQRRELAPYTGVLRPELATAALAGLAGALLLVVTSEELFRSIVPYLILLAACLLAVQGRVRAWLLARAGRGDAHRGLELAGIAAASVYGGYFGAGLGIMMLAVLGLFSDRTLTASNAVKSLLSFAVNVAAAAFLVFSGKIEWTLVAVMAPASLAGGQMGGTLVGLIPPKRLRPLIVAFALVVAVIYLVG